MPQKSEIINNVHVKAIQKKTSSIEEADLKEQHKSSCDVCGEEVVNKELVKEGRLYCSDECFEGDSTLSDENHSRKMVSYPILLNLSFGLASSK